MPTAAEFEEAARRFDEAARLAEQAAQRPQRSLDPQTIWGGRVTHQVNDVVRRSRSDGGKVAAQLRSMATECRRRAQVAMSVASSWESYDRSYASYEAQLDAYNNGSSDYQPTPPSPPASGPNWVEL